jgi:hypothetical protein
MAPFNIIHIRAEGAHGKPEGSDFNVDTLCGIRVPEMLCGDPSKATCAYCAAASGRVTLRRGRKAMTAREREVVSERMKRYWAGRPRKA